VRQGRPKHQRAEIDMAEVVAKTGCSLNKYIRWIIARLFILNRMEFIKNNNFLKIKQACINKPKQPSFWRGPVVLLCKTLTIFSIPLLPADSNKDRGTFSEFMGVSDDLLKFLVEWRVQCHSLKELERTSKSHYKDMRIWRQFTWFRRSDREMIGRFWCYILTIKKVGKFY